MLRIDHIQALRVFLNRVQLSGQEVPAFNNVMNGLIAEEQAIVAEAQKAQAAAAEAAGKKAGLLKVVDNDAPPAKEAGESTGG